MTEAPKGAELVRGDAADFVRDLKARPGGDIIVMGGGELGSALIEAGLVDEIGINVHPILLGAGTPAFRPMARRVALELLEAKPIAKGCVFLRYRVVNP
jgi:dihydrofolate reductase